MKTPPVAAAGGPTTSAAPLPAPTRRRRLRGLRYAAPVVVLWCVPVAAVLALQAPQRTSEAAVLDGAPIDTVPVGQRQHTMRTSVRADFVLADPVGVGVTAGGLVTAVHATAGMQITAGMLLAEVDGVGVLANRDPRPYHRDLVAGARGADVAQLNGFLHALGLSAADGDRFTAATTGGVRALQEQLGAQADGVFRPQYTWFVPVEFTDVAGVDVRVGDILAPGDVVLAAARPALSAAIVAEDAATGGQPLASLAGQVLVLVVGTDRLPLAGLALQGADAQALFEQLTAAADGPAQPDPEVDTQVFSGLAVELAEPPTFGTVPRSALYTADSGTVCVFQAPADGRWLDAAAVELPPGSGTGFEVTTALVPADLAGTEVVVNPTRLPVEARARCT